jgi:hypothetical protein
MTSQLGQLKQVNLRAMWSNETQKLTPWLAAPENIDALGEALGLELEVENTEVAVGPYSADILAKDTGTDTYVVIENQLEKTNHDHLGKLITYASVLEASAVVWIAPQFTEEHKKALDWLNAHTTEEVAYYGVVMELWQIDDSKPAVRFNVVSKPSEVIRQAIITKSNEALSDTRRLQLEFWTQFRDRLVESRKLPSTQLPRPQYWYNIPIGRAGIHVSCTANTYENKIGVRLYLSSRLADAALSYLMQEREDIEKEIGHKLEWNPHPDKRDKIIVLTRPAEIDKRENWPEYLNWMLTTVLKFREAFSKRVKNIEITQEDTDNQET